MNPKSGTMMAPKHLSSIIEKFSAAGYLTEVLMTGGRGDARDFAYEYGSDVDKLVVSGGDGTFNEVVDGLISAGHKTEIGYIPAGSTNDFGKSVGLSNDVNGSTDRIIFGTAKPVDIGSFNGRYFSYVASFGAFTSATYSVPQNLKNIFGHAAYVIGGAKELTRLKPIHAKFTTDPGSENESVLEDDYLIGAVCNSRSIGGILKLDKLDVDMNDGIMEILLVRMPRNVIELNEIALSMLSGNFKSKHIDTLSAKEVRIEIEEGVHWTIDGEYEEGSEVCEIKMLQSAINLIR